MHFLEREIEHMIANIPVPKQEIDRYRLYEQQKQLQFPKLDRQTYELYCRKLEAHLGI